MSFIWKLIRAGWIGVIAITAVVWFTPLLPFKAEILWVLGVVSGRYLARLM
jgi:hypothetical protein